MVIKTMITKCCDFIFRTEMHRIFDLSGRINDRINLAGGYGSRMWKPYEQTITETQITAENFVARHKERHGMVLNVDERAKSRRDENIKYQSGRKSYCIICSEQSTEIRRRPWPVYHTHRSSKQQRLHMSLDSYGQYNCHTCKISPHGFKTGDRLAIYVSSSTMDSWQGEYKGKWYEGDPFHLNFITIPGATIDQLHHGFASEYQTHCGPMDVLFCGGLNNLLRGHSVEIVCDQLLKFRQYVMELGYRKGYENTFAITTLPYPPKICRLPLDPYPGPGFRNRTADLNEINGYIMELNNHHDGRFFNRRAPQFHTYGICAGVDFGRGAKVGNLNMHRPSNWRESEFYDKLHLSDWKRLQMGKAVIQYFLTIYEMANYHNAVVRSGQKKTDEEVSRREGERENDEWANATFEFATQQFLNKSDPKKSEYCTAEEQRKFDDREEKSRRWKLRREMKRREADLVNAVMENRVRQQ